MKPTIEIRAIVDQGGFSQCIALQERVWGDSAAELVPRHIFVVANKTGGQVLGAFVADQLVGFLLAFAGLHESTSYLHSHMTGVDPEFQDKGIGRLLKLKQRDEALARGITRVVWTFDPFRPRNAYFNLVRLGAIVRTILPDVYGITTSHLDGGLPTDRLLAEWKLDSPRVVDAIAGSPPKPADGALEIKVTPAETAGDKLRLRQEFQALLQSGYMATGVIRGEGSFSYVFERQKVQAPGE